MPKSKRKFNASLVLPVRILIYALNYAPELSGAGKYTAELAQGLLRRGCQVRVVAAPPYYPAWRVADGYSTWRYRREWMDGIEVVRCPLWVPRHASGLRRVVHLLSFAASSFPVMLKECAGWTPDIVLCIAPAIFTAPGALAAARLCGARAMLHVQDFEIEAAFKLGLLRSNWARRLAMAVEERVLRGFDHVGTISGRMLERLWQKGAAAERASVLPNGVDLLTIRPIDSFQRLAWRRRVGIPDEAFLALYAGSIGAKQGLELLVEAARRIGPADKICFVICGDGPGRERLSQLAAGVDAVRFLPLQPAAELNAMLNAADLHLLPQLAEAEDLVMPSKLGPMLACGGAVLATAREGTELASVVKMAGGVVIPPGDAGLLARTIRALAADRSRLEQAGVCARALALEHLDRERIFDHAHCLLNTLLASDRSPAIKVANAQVQKFTL